MPLQLTYSPYYGLNGGVPLVDANDVLFVGDDTGVRAIASDGTPLWSRPLGVPAALGEGGTLYVVNKTGLEAARADGTIAWTHPWPKAHNAAPWPPVTIGVDRDLYLTDPSSVTAIGPDGALTWSASLPLAGCQVASYACGAPGQAALGPDGTLYLPTMAAGDPGSEDNQVLALGPDGTTKWRLDSALGHQPSGYTMVGADGSLYVSGQASTDVVDPAGTLRRSLDVSGGMAAGPDGDVFIRGANLVHFRADGTSDWSIEATGGGDVIVVNDGVYLPMYCNASTRCTPGLRAVTLQGEPLWSMATDANPAWMVVGKRVIYALEVQARDQRATLVAISD